MNAVIVDDQNCAKALDYIVKKAASLRASDIHIEPTSEQWRVRMRVDGLLHILHPLPFDCALFPNIISRIKVLAALDIGESRLPQDGRWNQNEDGLDIRVSTLATRLGEKVVMRLFNARTTPPKLSEIGLTDGQLTRLRSLNSTNEGMVLVVGPTGSGKTTTLYALIDCLNQSTINIVSAEDPIERALDDVNQVEVNTKAKRDFTTILRAFLRQDPDIMLIGEIRDEHSAQIALRAAQTGHLVLTTVHANDIPGAYRRLSHLGIDRFDAESCVRAVINQRLVRTVCPLCHAKTSAVRACNRCVDGFWGRSAVCEIGTLSETANPTIECVAQKLLHQGKTTAAELLRTLDLSIHIESDSKSAR